VNRRQQRAMASMKRKAPVVNTQLLQKAFDELQKEAMQMRNVLFSLVKEAGRLRFRKATVETLSPEDGIEAVLDGGTYTITYKKHEAPEAPKGVA
jgi:hypothetical protein